MTPSPTSGVGVAAHEQRWQGGAGRHPGKFFFGDVVATTSGRRGPAAASCEVAKRCQSYGDFLAARRSGVQQPQSRPETIPARSRLIIACKRQQCWSRQQLAEALGGGRGHHDEEQQAVNVNAAPPHACAELVFSCEWVY
ncbi:hypothetical protein E2562_004070 [Oryza meyeriana var. granulata]|uniref:Uncharacterized protein n=1 Tax=Oryza meyeriana var. granulata TaxID=110450 RepID=A0A6G1BIV7_9ORYZ|nr:hypothetical protein E2562_004070 [Oryza meyeriana var. granulata]